MGAKCGIWFSRYRASEKVMSILEESRSDWLLQDLQSFAPLRRKSLQLTASSLGGAGSVLSRQKKRFGAGRDLSSVSAKPAEPSESAAGTAVHLRSGSLMITAPLTQASEKQWPTSSNLSSNFLSWEAVTACFQFSFTNFSFNNFSSNFPSWTFVRSISSSESHSSNSHPAC